MAFILPETDCHFLAFFFCFFFVFSPCSGRRAASCRPLYSTEQQRGEESSWVHLQKGCRWAWKTCSVLCVCSCLALHTSAKLGSSIRSVVWACWREMDWEREREWGTEVFWCFLCGFLLHLSLSRSSFVCFPPLCFLVWNRAANQSSSWVRAWA